MTAPTAADLLAGLHATTQADDAKRLRDQLATAIGWALLVGGALMLPALVVASVVAR